MTYPPPPDGCPPDRWRAFVDRYRAAYIPAPDPLVDAPAPVLSKGLIREMQWLAKMTREVRDLDAWLNTRIEAGRQRKETDIEEF